MEYTIQIQSLTKNFGNLAAVKGISFEIPKGSIFGLLGPNGSGKSTTIRMLCGVITPTSGQGKVLGYDLYKDTERIKQNIGYMSQRFGLYEDLTVAENIDFYGSIYMIDKKSREERKKQLMALAGLEGREKALAATLSGGMKQKLALCCALIHEPQLLVLDEPTAGVDPVSRREFWRVITSLAASGITVLVTTHYMDEASICDIIGFIYNGSLITVDTPEELFRKHQTGNLEEIFIEYVAQLSNKEAALSFREIKQQDSGV